MILLVLAKHPSNYFNMFDTRHLQGSKKFPNSHIGHLQWWNLNVQAIVRNNGIDGFGSRMIYGRHKFFGVASWKVQVKSEFIGGRLTRL